MRVISHRGWWSHPNEKNQATAFRRSFEAGLGTETDLRDLDGEVVVSHDPPRRAQKPMTFVQLLELYVDSGGCDSNLPLALNIKSDGLAESVSEALERFSVSASFVFDMAVPDMRSFISCGGVDVFARQSDVEHEPVYIDRVAGVWLDSFGPDGWIMTDTIAAHTSVGRRVCVVSSELHGRAPEGLWERLIRGHRSGTLGEDVLVCSDRPDELVDLTGGAQL